MTPLLKHLVRAALLACCVLAATAAPAAAKKPTPCWLKLINDWYDGRIDNVYPPHCYREAVNQLPDDVKTYSSAREDILRALADAIQKKNHVAKGATTPGATTTTPAPVPAGTGPSSTTPAPTPTTPSPTPAPTSTTPDTAGRQTKGPINEALDKITPGGADALPLPLLILGGLALLLVGAGIAGMVLRRIQARRPA